ncbi:hypothetical protein CGCSCA5_v007445 [Colletotrichum siamense]|nr:hypothetical protein CGCSCA5_v007445 [Colletotrichum siamense]
MVSSRLSDITSSSTLSHKSIKTEVSAVAGVVVKERSDESLTIGVVREQSLDELEKVCAEGPKLLGLIRRKLIRAPPMLFTTAQGLQDTIAAIKTRSKHHILNLLSTELEQAELRQHFDTLSGKSRWNDVRAVVSAIVGLAVGTVKLKIAANAAVGGVYVKYAFGFHALEIGAAGAKAATVITAAGPAVVMGVTVAAAVYFIPWESLMDWLMGALSFLWDKVCAV